MPSVALENARLEIHRAGTITLDMMDALNKAITQRDVNETYKKSTRRRADDPKYLERVRLLMTFIEQLRHMYTLAKRVARTHLPVEVAAE